MMCGPWSASGYVEFNAVRAHIDVRSIDRFTQATMGAVTNTVIIVICRIDDMYCLSGHKCMEPQTKSQE
jgi:hypothetical protein